MDGIGRHRYLPVIEHVGGLYLLSYFNGSLARKERTDLREIIGLNVIDSPLRHHLAAVRAGSGPHFDHPVGFGQNLRVVIHQHHGISVSDQVIHHTAKANDVRRVQAD